MPTSLEITALARKIVDEIWASNNDRIYVNTYCEEKINTIYSSLGSLTISDLTESIIKKVVFYVNKKIDHCKTECTSPPFEFNHYPPNTLIRYSIKHEENPLMHILRKHKKELQGTINQMSWKSFEQLATYLLEVNGVSPITLTKVNQEGIDFCGLYDLGKYAQSLIIPQNLKARIIGQVKHYNTKINPSLTRAFATYCQSIKHNDQSIIQNLPGWFKDSKSPVLGIFITTSDFTKRARDYAQKEWIILKHGEHVIEELIKSPNNKNWLSNDKTGSLTFDKKLFLESFKKH
jgi:hypothetical protein